MRKAVKIISLCVAIILVVGVLAGCEKAVERKDIIGVWYDKGYKEDNSNQMVTLTFYENGEAALTLTIESIKVLEDIGNYSIDGNTITITFPDRNWVATYYNENGKVYLENELGAIFEKS